MKEATDQLATNTRQFISSPEMERLNQSNFI